MDKKLTDEEVLEFYGWEIECESPYEIRNMDGSFASGQATGYVIDGLHQRYYDEEIEDSSELENIKKNIS